MLWIILSLLAVAGLVGFLLANRRKAPIAVATPAGDSESARRHFLTALNGPKAGRTWHLGARRVTLGRGPMNYIQLNAPGVSRIATQFELKDGAMRVIDMSSRSGTEINGECVQSATLSEGDVIAVAGMQFEYSLLGDAKANAGFESKNVGSEVHATTTDASANLILRAQASYALHKGDEEAAARETGVSVERLRELLAG